MFIFLFQSLHFLEENVECLTFSSRKCNILLRSEYIWIRFIYEYRTQMEFETFATVLNAEKCDFYCSDLEVYLSLRIYLYGIC